MVVVSRMSKQAAAIRTCPGCGRLPLSGGDPVPLTDGRTKVWSPTWSADGGKVFYASNRGGGMDLWQQAVNTDGAPIGEPLSVTQGGLGITSAVFSPDGTKLAYARGGTVSNVWRVPIPVDDRPAVWADAVRITSEHAYHRVRRCVPRRETAGGELGPARQPGPLDSAVHWWRDDAADQ